MAYDPKDPADKAIVDKLIEDALTEAQEAHEADVEGLKKKNTELIAKISKLRADGAGADTGEIARLESELDTSNTKLRNAEGELRKVTRELKDTATQRDTLTTELATEKNVARDLLVNNGLTSALVEANVAPQFLDDVTASLSRQVEIKEVDGKREAFANGKPLGEFVKEWATGDRGKHYVVPPANGGGGAQPNTGPQGGAKKIYEMTEVERAEAYKANPADFNNRVAAGENLAPAKT